MSIARSVAEVLRDHVVLELEAIDRMYLNVYVPHLQTVGAVVGYLRVHRGQRFASTTAVMPMTEAFVRNIEQFVNDEGIDPRLREEAAQGRCHAEILAGRWVGRDGCNRPAWLGRAYQLAAHDDAALGARNTAPVSAFTRISTSSPSERAIMTSCERPANHHRPGPDLSGPGAENTDRRVITRWSCTSREKNVDCSIFLLSRLHLGGWRVVAIFRLPFDLLAEMP